MDDAVDAAVDAVADVPHERGVVETFTHAGMSLVAETFDGPPSAPTFLLVHGIGMGRSVFAELVHRLRPHGRVITIDQPGYGEAPEPPRTPTMERTADLVAAYLDAHRIGGVVAIGHSMGTQVVTEVAARHPHTVSRLVLIAPTVDRHHRRALSQLWRLAADLLDDSPAVLLLGTREYLRAGPHLRRKMTAMLRHRPEDTYPRVTVPTLVLRGEDDRVSTAGWCAEVVGLLPHATGVTLPGLGHETMIRNAAPTGTAILQFLAR